MIELPPGCSADEIDRLADWLETTVLLEAIDVSKFELMESLQASGLALPFEEGFAEDADEQGLDEDESTDAALERLADDVMARCRDRQLAYGDAYPFSVSVDLLSMRTDVDCDSYAFLLVADLGHGYKQLKYALTPDTQSGLLMEKVVEAALRGVFGHSQRFGWPREPDWPTGINERVGRLATELGLDVDSLDGKTDPADNDRTLDVVAMLRVSDPFDGSLAILTQCAAGQNWKSKLGEPSIDAWHNLLRWNCKLIRAVALPWRLGGRKSDWTYARAHSLAGGALIFDRPRLLAGNPDKHLDPAVRQNVAKWWWEAVAELPRAGLRTPELVAELEPVPSA